MPKRKRDDPPAVPQDKSNDKSRPSIQQQRADRRLEQGAEVLTKAFKVAKGFERQKLSRRRKTAQTKTEASNVARIDAETEALKILNLDITAFNYLAKSLLKIKAVATSPHIPASLDQSLSQPSDAPSLNVIARLCKSNPVRDVLPQILKDMQAILGVPGGDSSSRPAKARSAEPNAGRVTSARDRGQLDMSNDASDVDVPQRPASDPGSVATNGDEDDFEGFSTDPDVDAGDQGAGSDMDDDALAAFDARLASSSDDSDLDNEAVAQRKINTRALLDAYGSDPDADSESEASSHEEPSKGLPRRNRESRSQSPSRSVSPPPPKRPTTSAFIPSLTSGYISGGSDSDPDAEFDDLLGDGADKPKKNRRGQRARQAIWEKKFGQEAKHVKTEAKGSRNEGWDAKRGATDSRRGAGRGRGGGRGPRGRSNAAAGAPGAAIAEQKKAPVHRDDEGALHPSWAAAKKRKEAAMSSGPTKFAGKKISFD
ncbi:hypothetical protein ANO11243_078520 [Dothideomycetidae sp. 11243]|nr:hypothetical protein ANO11243_078520 [fungal sp. No.11243]